MPSQHSKSTSKIGVINANPLAGLANSISTVAKSGAGAQANAVSFASQAAQGAFNQASANNANAIGDLRTGDQYGYNSAMWQQAANWNQEMMQLAMAFNAEEAEKNRQFQMNMDSTKYQRAVKDMETAGLNPIMAVTGGGVSVGGGTGSTASVGAPQMSSASGGLLNGISASENNFTGQMDYLSGILGLISGALSGASSAMQNAGSLGMLTGESTGRGLAQEMGKLFENILNQKSDKPGDTLSSLFKDSIEIKDNSLADWAMKGFKKYSNIQPWSKNH